MLFQTQLLHCLRNAARLALESTDPARRKGLLEAVDIVANELLLQQDVEFDLEHLRQGVRLLQRGLALLDPAARDVMAGGTDWPEIIAGDTSTASIARNTEGLNHRLEQLVARLPARGDREVASYLDDLNAWEVALYARRLESVPKPELGLVLNLPITQEAFQAYLRNRFPHWTDLRVTRFSPLSGGYSKQTILFDTEDAINGPQALVIRAELAAPVVELYAVHVADEFPILELVHAGGACVPEPLWVENDKTLLGTRFIVSRRAPGRNLGTAIGATETITDGMVRSLIDEVVKIHRMDLRELAPRLAGTVFEAQLAVTTLQEAALAVVGFWRRMGQKAGISASPVIERGLRWLEENAEPCDAPPVLLHGDYGLHNVLIEGERVSAVLDWEVAHIGDPAEEISWLLACTSDHVSSDQLLSLYYQAGGRHISEFRLRYFDVFQCVKIPISCLAALKVFDTRLDNIQYAVYGLRFMHHYAARLAASIRAAEAVRDGAAETD